MCEIQLIIGKNKTLSTKNKKLFISMLLNGAIGNNDAFGFYYPNKLYKNFKSPQEDEKWDEIQKEIVGCKTPFLLGHNRLATSGLTGNNNNHPFQTDRFVVVHNGIISNHAELKNKHKLKYSEEVDSYIVPALLEKFIEKMPIERLLKFVAESIVGGYSIFIFDKIDNVFYYFKNDRQSISAVMTDDAIVISTNRQSIEFEKENCIFERNVYLEGEFKSGMVYKINLSGEIEKVTPFEIKTYYYRDIKEKYVWVMNKKTDVWYKQKPEKYYKSDIKEMKKKITKEIGFIESSYFVNNECKLTLYVKTDKNVSDIEKYLEVQELFDYSSVEKHKNTIKIQLWFDNEPFITDNNYYNYGNDLWNDDYNYMG